MHSSELSFVALAAWQINGKQSHRAEYRSVKLQTTARGLGKWGTVHDRKRLQHAKTVACSC
jgi:hypothetical protein